MTVKPVWAVVFGNGRFEVTVDGMTLQTLLEKYPNLLAGAQMNPEMPRRWVLVTREVPVPDAEGGADRWYLDHLLLDQK